MSEASAPSSSDVPVSAGRRTRRRPVSRARVIKKKRRVKIPWTKVFSGTTLSIPAGIFLIDKYVSEVSFLHTTVAFPLDLLQGTAGFWLAITLGFLGWYAGFHIKRWPRGIGLFLAIVMAGLIISSMLQPFYTQFLYTRQLEGNPPLYGDIDTSFLSSPFLSDLFESLRDLAQQLLSGDYVVMKVYAADDGQTMDATQDHYLYRWRAFEKYSFTQKDFDLPSSQELTTMTFHNERTDIPSNIQGAKRLRFDLNLTVISNQANQELLTTWNSLYRSDLENIDFAAGISNPVGANVVEASVSNNSGNQPFISAKFADGSESEFFATSSYTGYWYPENKSQVVSGSLNYSQVSNLYNSDVQGRWGGDSFTGITRSQYVTGSTGFQNAYNNYLTKAQNKTIFEVVQMVYNDLVANYLDLNNLLPSNPDAEGQDPAYFVYDGGSPGIEELVLSFVLMLRALYIPARPIMGYSIGTYISDATGPHYEIRNKNLHYWTEVLIPVSDDNGRISYRWAIFNLIPDANILAASGGTILDYGRNAFGGSGNFQVSVRTSTSIQQVTMGNDRVQVYVQPLGKDMIVDVIARDGSGNPLPSQAFSLKLLDENNLNAMLAAINQGDLGTALQILDENGILLADGTTNSTGGYEYRTKIAGNGTIEGTNTQVNRLNIQSQPYNVYALIAISGLSYGYSGVGFLASGNIEVFTLAKQVEYQDPQKNQNVTGYITVPDSSIPAFANLTDVDTGNSLPNEGIDWYLLDSDNIADPANIDFTQFVGQNFSSSVTNSSGIANTTVVFKPTDSGLYIVAAHWQGTDVYGYFFVYVTNDIVLIAQGTTPDSQSLSQSSQQSVSFSVTTQAIAFSQTAGIDQKNAEGILIRYYLIKDTYYTESMSYDTLEAQMATWTNQTEYLNLTTWFGYTDTTGTVSITLVLSNVSVIGVGTWRIVAITKDGRDHVQHGTGLILTGAPLPLTMSNQQQKIVDIDHGSSPRIGIPKVHKLQSYTLPRIANAITYLNEGVMDMDRISQVLVRRPN